VLNNESIKIIDFETYIGTYECKSNIFMLKTDTFNKNN